MLVPKRLTVRHNKCSLEIYIHEINEKYFICNREKMAKSYGFISMTAQKLTIVSINKPMIFPFLTCPNERYLMVCALNVIL